MRFSLLIFLFSLNVFSQDSLPDRLISAKKESSKPINKLLKHHSKTIVNPHLNGSVLDNLLQVENLTEAQMQNKMNKGFYASSLFEPGKIS